jgi:hypothetical protein
VEKAEVMARTLVLFLAIILPCAAGTQITAEKS